MPELPLRELAHNQAKQDPRRDSDARSDKDPLSNGSACALTADAPYPISGYAAHAIRALLVLAFGSGRMMSLTASCAIENRASLRVAEKCGFRLIATIGDRYANFLTQIDRLPFYPGVGFESRAPPPSKPGRKINNAMIKKNLHTPLLLILPALMSACVLPASVETRDSTVDGKFGYIASAARSKYGNGYVLYVENIDNKEERTFQLIEAYPINRVFDDVDTPPHINMIKVPPGTYALTGWAAYGWGFHDKNAGRKFDPQSTIAEPFPVAPGSVVFLGDFVTDNHVASVLTMKYQIIPQSIDIDSARNEFINAYPAFKDAIFICKLCSLNDRPEKRQYNFVKP